MRLGGPEGEFEWMGASRETVSDRRNGDEEDAETVEDVLDVDREEVEGTEETAIVRWEDPTVANIL